jgi:hypothetical protein
MTATNSPLGNGNAEATSTPRRAADEDARQVVIVNSMYCDRLAIGKNES